MRRNGDYQKAYKEYCDFVFNLGLPDGDTSALVNERFYIIQMFPDISKEKLSEYEEFNIELAYQVHEQYFKVTNKFGQIEGLENDGVSLPCPSTPSEKWARGPIDTKPSVKFHGLTYSESGRASGFSGNYSWNGRCLKDLDEYMMRYKEKEHESWIKSLIKMNEIETTADLPTLKIRATSKSLICEVDVSGNILEQIEDIKAAALEQQSILKKNRILGPEVRNRIKDFTPYLRVFDGDLVGFSVAEMAEELFPDIRNEYPNYLANKRVRNLLSKAKRLVDSEYELLAKI